MGGHSVCALQSIRKAWLLPRRLDGDMLQDAKVGCPGVNERCRFERGKFGLARE